MRKSYIFSSYPLKSSIKIFNKFFCNTHEMVAKPMHINLTMNMNNKQIRNSTQKNNLFTLYL